MPGPVMKVEGARELRKTLKAAGDDLHELRDTHKQVAAQVAPVARSLAPKRTGRLAGTIRPAGTKTAAIVRAGSKAVPYAGVQEWGWGRRNIRAQPYLTRAAKQTEPVWSHTYEVSVQAILAKVKGTHA